MNQIRIGALLSYISIFLTFFVGLIYTPLLVRFLGQSNYGIYSIVLSLVAYLSLMDMGVGNTVVRYVSRNRAVGDFKKESDLIGQFLKFFGAISILTLVVGLILSSSISNLFGNSLSEMDIKTVEIMIIILTVNLAVSFPLNVYSSVLQAYERFIFLRLSTIIRILVTPIISLISLVLGGGLISITVITTVVNLGILLMGFVYCKLKLKTKVTFSAIEPDLKKEIIIFSLLIFITSVADKIYWQTDQLLLGILENSDVVAVYAIAIQFVMIFMSLSTVISGLYLPKITKIVTEVNHMGKLNSLFVKLSKMQFYILTLAFTGFILIGEYFIEIWAGPAYNLAYILVIILMLPFFFDLIQNVGLVILQAKGLYLFRTVTLIVFSILNVVISIPIIGKYGSVGTAIITAIFVALGNVILLNMYYQFKIGLDMKSYWIAILKVSLPIIVYSSIVYLFKKNLLVEIGGFQSLFTFAILYTLGYLVVIYKFCIKETERQFLLEIIKSKI